MRDEMNNKDIPLCVDLDGTLILTDLLWESLVALARKSPFSLLLLPFWLLKGKAFFKRSIASRVQIDASCLPYRQELIQYIEKELGKGREIVLATASDSILAQGVADHLGFFDRVLASNGETNLSRKNKSSELSRLYGNKGYEYAGNSNADMEVWRHAKSAIVFSESPKLLNQVKQIAKVSYHVIEKKSVVGLIWKSARPHQWAKNTLVFVPLLSAHQLGDSIMLLHGFLAFISISMCASSAYFFNDLLDLDSDRIHSKKCNRPLASGKLSIPKGMVASVLFLFFGGALATTLPVGFQLVLLLYYSLTILYSMVLKSRLLIDVFSLAVLYTLRIFAGGIAVGVALSQWLLAFSMFLFISLAFVKRYAELLELQHQGRDAAKGRGYMPSDMNHLGVQGVVSGYLASVILALYINSHDVLELYTHNDFLWFLPPLFLYWISRVWMVTHRGEMYYDPIVFALRDGVSYAVLCMSIAVLWTAT